LGIAGPESRRKGHPMTKEKKAELAAIKVLLFAGWVMVPGGVLLPPPVKKPKVPRKVTAPRKGKVRP